jgi:condensin complex subunit 1
LQVVAMLLGSKQSTDILEGIDFFVSAFEFGVQNAMLGVRRMLSLIWSATNTICTLSNTIYRSGEATIRDAVVSAYKRLYIEGGGRSANAATARNLIALVS